MTSDRIIPRSSQPYPPPAFQRAPRRAGGFTLIEILVVLGIMILLAAAAVPAFRFIVGARSIDGAQNVAGAMIARARTQALIDHRGSGVLFFRDPVSDRSTMALIQLEGDSVPDPDFLAYEGWTDGQDQVKKPFIVSYWDKGSVLGPSYVQALNGFPTKPGVEIYGPLNVERVILQQYKCSKSHAKANQANRPVSSFWGVTNGNTHIELVDGVDPQILPLGVGVQLINDQHSNDGFGGRPYFDRYLRTGAIMFDSNGKFASIPFDVMPDSNLGKMIGIATSVATGPFTLYGNNYPVPIAKPPPPVYSQFGLVLYDRESFKGMANQVKNAVPTEGDLLTLKSMPIGAPPTFKEEQAEESWLDANTMPLVINRYNGTLIKGE